MALSKKEVIEKILSFKLEELANWIRSRLHGDDRYFPIYEGYEPNLSKFLSQAFHHIKNETFRDNFLEILDDLTAELWSLTRDKKQIEENKEYIYELLSLYSSIKNFRNKARLFDIAKTGKLKGIEAHNLELHQLLLNALASYHVAGSYDFWIEQMQDDSNKYYANAAFYALVNGKYDLDVLFDHIGIFIGRFKEEIDLVWGLRALINSWGLETIIEKFKAFESIFSAEQKAAVNAALNKSGYKEIFM